MNTSRLDLTEVGVVDNHAHALTHAQPTDVVALRNHFAESHADIQTREHVLTAPYYRWTIHQLAAFSGVEPTEDAVLQVREAEPLERYARRLGDAAGLAYLLLDEGYPPPEESIGTGEVGRIVGVPVRRMLRIETLLQEIMLAQQQFGDVVEAFDEALRRAHDEGVVALKSIACYRTGLAIEHVQDAEAAGAFALLRPRIEQPFRLMDKTLIDYFVIRALRFAAPLGWPMQFHTGYGDPDLDMRLANPLHLRGVFEDRDLSGAPIVMLHESWPYTAEAAFLAAVYPNAYVDLAYSLPPLGRGEYLRCTQIALNAAPASKVMVSSDGTRIPEHYYLGALRARECVGDVLGEMVDHGDLGHSEAMDLATMVLRGNAERVYRLS